MVNTMSNERKNGQPEGQVGKTKRVQSPGCQGSEYAKRKGDVHVESHQKVTIRKCPLDLVIRGWWQGQLRWKKR